MSQSVYCSCTIWPRRSSNASLLRPPLMLVPRLGCTDDPSVVGVCACIAAQRGEIGQSAIRPVACYEQQRRTLHICKRKCRAKAVRTAHSTLHILSVSVPLLCCSLGSAGLLVVGRHPVFIASSVFTKAECLLGRKADQATGFCLLGPPFGTGP